MPRFIQNTGSQSKSISVSERHKLGAFYTPKVVTQHALKEVLQKLTEGRKPEELLKFKILDPSFGDGVFLETVLEHFLSYIESRVERFDRKGWSRRIQTNCLFGVDINPSIKHVKESVRDSNLFVGANSLLSAWIFPSEGGSGKSETILACPKTGKDSNFEERVTQQLQNLLACVGSKQFSYDKLKFIMDSWLAIRLGFFNDSELSWAEFVIDALSSTQFPSSLALKRVQKISKTYRFFHWELEVAKKCGNLDFQLVCGNPPWEVIESENKFRWDFLPPDSIYSQYVGSQYFVPTGRRVELAAAFTNLSFRLLKNKGQLSFLLPSSVNNAKTYESIRKLGFESSVQYNRFDNNSGVFAGLDKRCDFTCLSLNFEQKRSLVVSSSTYRNEIFEQSDIKIKGSSNVSLLGGGERVIPNLKNKNSTDAIMKILSICEPIASHGVEFETWNGLNSTTDRHLFKGQMKGLNSPLPLLSGNDINILSTLTKEHTSADKWVEKNDLAGRGFSNKLKKHIWEVDRLGWRKISRADDTRTLIVAPLAKNTANVESLWSIVFLDSDFQTWCEFIWSSIPFDALARTVVNSNVSKFILLGLPVPTIDTAVLKTYNILRKRLGQTTFGSEKYFDVIKETNSLAFKFFGLSNSQIDSLVRSYFNVRHPGINRSLDPQMNLIEEAA
jgi:hypothetical protein